MISRRRANRGRHKLDNRLHFLLAVVFLLGGVLVYQLFKLQVMEHDLYTALALDQHQVYNQLEPSRGRIFIRDSQESIGELYPIATNKEFGLLYTVPKKVVNPKETADKLYEIFDQKKIEKEINDLLDEDEYFTKLEGLDAPEIKKRLEFRQVKYDLELEQRKTAKTEEYLAKLTKKNDPYEPLKKKVPEEELAKVVALNNPGLDFVMENYRYYPEENIGSHIIGFVGYVGEERIGNYGLEGFFNDELTGRAGSIKAERAASGELIIIKDREYIKPVDGSDLVLTINRSIQFEACRRLEEEAMRHGADGGTILVMKPDTGAILAMCSWPDYDPNNYQDVENIKVFNNPAIFEQYEPGSVFKVITMAAGLDQGVVEPDTTYNDEGQIMIEGWPKPIRNSDYASFGGHGRVNMVTVLEKSLNTGAIFVMQQTTPEVFAKYVKDFGFGEKSGIELETEGVSNIKNLLRKNIRPIEAATASFGQGITVTPLQMISAYAAIANGGILMKPYLVAEVRFSGGDTIQTQPRQIRRVISERAALLLSGMMVNVVDGGHAIKAAVPGYFVAGKTGTAQMANKNKKGYSNKTIHTFVGFAPVDEPMFVMLVKLDDPKDVQYSASSAAPLFGELAEFILNYYQVPKER